MRVWNRTAAKSQAWTAKYPGSAGATVAEAVKDADFVMVCVGNDDDLRSVVLGENGALEGMKKGSVLVDHTTASAAVARELHALAKSKGIGFVDAPVSGGEAGAVNGALTVMCGGDEEDYARAEPVIKAGYAKMCRRMGGPGTGQLTKMVNQVAIGGVLQGLAEGFSLAKASGLDIEGVVDVIGKGAAQSWQMDNRWKTMTQGEFNLGFQVSRGVDMSLSKASTLTRFTCRSNGCARTSRSCWKRPRKGVFPCRRRRLSTNSTPRSSKWAAHRGTLPRSLPVKKPKKFSKNKRR